MREQIEYLINFHNSAKEEAWEELNELSKINSKKFLEEDKQLLKDRLLLLEQEYSMRGSFIRELEDLLKLVYCGDYRR